MELLSVPFFQKPPQLINLYEKFVKGFQENINQLSLAQFAVAASRQLGGKGRFPIAKSERLNLSNT